MNKGFILVEALIILTVLSLITSSIINLNNFQLKQNSNIITQMNSIIKIKNDNYQSIKEGCETKCILKKALLVLKP